MASSSASSTAQVLSSVFHHVALPPRLPAKHDGQLQAINKILAERFLQTARSLRDSPHQGDRDQWNWLSRTLHSCVTLHDGGKLNATTLADAFAHLEPNGLLIVYVEAQNAGLLIHRYQKDQVGFEVFEASARAENVLAAQAALRWDFPGNAASIPLATFYDIGFRWQLAIFLDQASQESIIDFAPTTMKARSGAFESRDSCSPSLISSMLMTLLEANGHRTAPVLVQKRIRDEVCWSDGAEVPWRRSPYYLVLRVGVQRFFLTLFKPDAARIHYKHFLCCFMGRLCDDLRQLSLLEPEELAFMRTKLCRRLIKLENDWTGSSISTQESFERIFSQCKADVQKTLDAVNEQISQCWQAFKQRIKRPVPRVAQTARKESFALSLKNSGRRLNAFLQEGRQLYFSGQSSNTHPGDPLPTIDLSNVPRNTSVDTYVALAAKEHDLKIAGSPNVNWDATSSGCLQLAQNIIDYTRRALGPYDGNPDAKSTMLLTLMEAWTFLDRGITILIPLLREFDPGFPRDILNDLHILSYDDIHRLHSVDTYLQDRNRTSRSPFFSDLVKGCFAERYFEESAHSEVLSAKLQLILDDAAVSRSCKEEQWRERQAEYENLLRQANEKSCFITVDEQQPLMKVHDKRRCNHCYLQRRAKRVRIEINEDPLPEDSTCRKAILSESEFPDFFLAYRYATWVLLRDLARPRQPPEQAPQVLVEEYAGLTRYFPTTKYPIGLGSKKKSFLSSHYSSVRCPVSLEKVCLPHGLEWGLFDSEKNLWTARQRHPPSFRQHCAYQLPATSQLAVLQFSSDFNLDGNNLSGNKIVASQSKCPSKISVQEFLAFQDLHFGRDTLWLKLLRELGSSNLNLSAEAISLIIGKVTLKAGEPMVHEPLRSKNWVFRDRSFCSAILQQLEEKLLTIENNWRETVSMESMINLGLRLWSFASETDVIEAAEAFLLHVRKITIHWMDCLQQEIFESQDGETSQKRSRDASWAALLCRKTFAMDTTRGIPNTLSSDAIQAFVGSSIVLKNNLSGKLSSMSRRTRNALVNDYKLAYHLSAKVQKSILMRPTSMASAVNKAWPARNGALSRVFTDWTFLDGQNRHWVTATTIPGPGENSKSVLYNLIDGNLLVDGQPLGQLPEEFRSLPLFREIFANRNVSTYPSDLQGMTYVVANLIEKEHQVHFAIRNGDLLVRACYNPRHRPPKMMQLLPPDLFYSGDDFDLPTPLIANSAHWLDYASGKVEIRKRAAMWKSKDSDWHLDVVNRCAARRQSHLLDPDSLECRRFGQIFDRFESRKNLLVYQPTSSVSLRIDLPRFELSFRISRAGILICKQLKAEIALDQDAGTFYGLYSKLVLRDLVHKEQRSVIIPMGDVIVHRNQFHISVNITSSNYIANDYTRLSLNDDLCRVESPSEPLILYLKALLHACTSFIVPDVLTGRTGTEEALECLRSGSHQPWAPLGLGPFEVLTQIAQLAPWREFYPSDVKVMQRTVWNPNLTATVQHEDFQRVTEAIVSQAQEIGAFYADATKARQLPSRGSLHLLERARARLCGYRCNFSLSPEPLKASDQKYDSRDRCYGCDEQSNVLKCASLIRDWRRDLPVTLNLAGVLQTWPNIGGYGEAYEKVLLSSILHVDVSVEWGSLCSLCANINNESQKYELMFFLSIMCFRTGIDLDIVGTLIAYATITELKYIKTPDCPLYVRFHYQQVPRFEELVSLVQQFRTPYPGDDRQNPSISLDYKERRRLRDNEQEHIKQSQEDCKALVSFLLNQWPNPELTMEGFDKVVLVNINDAWDCIHPEWKRLIENYELSKYVKDVQQVLSRHHCKRELQSNPELGYSPKVLPPCRPTYEIPSLRQILLSDAPVTADDWDTTVTGLNLALQEVRLRRPTDHSRTSSSTMLATSVDEMRQLRTIVQSLVNSNLRIRQRYGMDLNKSLSALSTLKEKPKIRDTFEANPALNQLILQISSHVKALFEMLSVQVGSQHRFRLLNSGDLWPRVTPLALVRCLASTSQVQFGSHMRDAVIDYSYAIASLQRVRRIARIKQEGNDQRLASELENSGHTTWSLRDIPDWLLLEIEGDITIREDQVEVAQTTISPASGKNSLVQMNMGAGKTSVIVPMVAARLANSRQLCRIIVPRPLLLQMAQLLQSRLGNLLGRTIKHLPFSRRTPTNPDTTKSYRLMHQQIMDGSGIMLCLPEHLLSFKLSGVQRLADKRIPEAVSMINMQNWLDSFSRDVLDESDFTLAVRTQLIYPSGAQSTVDGHPHRWKTVEVLLQMFADLVWNLKDEFPKGIEVVRRSTEGFPTCFFLRKEVEDTTVSRLGMALSHGHGSLLPIYDLSPRDKTALERFLSRPVCTREDVNRIMNLFHDRDVAMQNTLLLRGLLVHRLLILALSKRVNVTYGLHPNRDPIAVPFHSKGVPSDQAEWGHPDVAILLTCLSFYYDGLQEKQIRQALEYVLRSDDPGAEYDRWAQESSSLPSALRSWNAINLDDEIQIQEVWKHMRFNKTVIDHFLNTFVFPKYAKQFETQLRASGWDIPLMRSAPTQQKASNKENVPMITSKATVAKPEQGSQVMTTGFSGTNDNRFVLPMTIEQRDLSTLHHTNAEVLSYLLQPRNRRYLLIADAFKRRISEKCFLEILAKYKIRMLIDAGAQILEFDNLDLVKAWLEVDPSSPAAVYFNAENKAIVRYRFGHEVPLLASPFADDLGDCLVYLDEAHTRGTDLKMPKNATGALTLGPGQTKDHTVQAAMRLRQLGTSQSIVWFAPREVHQSILDCRHKRDRDPIDSYDVVWWLLDQTCRGLEHMQTLYYAQGTDFCTRAQAALDKSEYLKSPDHRAAYLKALARPESLTLKQLYLPKPLKQSWKPEGSFTTPALGTFMKKLYQVRESFQDTGNAVHASAAQEVEVEQEREVAIEAETVREVQKPSHREPEVPLVVHRDIIHFAETGELVSGSVACDQIFVALRNTDLGAVHGINDAATKSNIHVTKDFSRTVKLPSGKKDDSFLRPVEWILWSPSSETALIISPHEAEELLPRIRDAKNPRTHLIIYAAPVTRKMLHFNDLAFYSVPAMDKGWRAPRWLAREIGIFAGRLYFPYDEYADLCHYLGIKAPKQVPNVTQIDGTFGTEPVDAQEEVAMDDTKKQEEHEPKKARVTFTARPLTFLQEWLAIRRKGQDFTHTPMGYVCQSKELTPNHPFFRDGGGHGEGAGMQGDHDGAGKPRTLPNTVITRAESDHEEEAHDDDEGEGEDVMDDEDVEALVDGGYGLNEHLEPEGVGLDDDEELYS